jgi:predicted TIM-barrel fold metal-dependent hydrolase
VENAEIRNHLKLQRKTNPVRGFGRGFGENKPRSRILLWTVRTLGVDHVMFGSDFPVGTPTDAIDALSRFGFTDIELSAIARETAAKIFQLGL